MEDILEKLELLEADLKKSIELKSKKPTYGFNDELFLLRIKELIEICKKSMEKQENS